RVASAITDIVESSSAETIVIVAHGAVLRGAAAVLLELGGAGRIGVLGNCGYGELRYTGNGWVLSRWSAKQRWEHRRGADPMPRSRPRAMPRPGSGADEASGAGASALIDGANQIDERLCRSGPVEDL